MEFWNIFVCIMMSFDANLFGCSIISFLRRFFAYYFYYDLEFSFYIYLQRILLLLMVFGCCILCERSTYKFYLRGCWIFFIAWILNERKRICNRMMAKGKKRKKSRKKSTKFAFILILLKIIQLKSTKGRTPQKKERKMWIRWIQARCNDGGSS